MFARVLFSLISRVRTSRKCPLQFMSIYSNENISKIAKLSPCEFPHLVQNRKIICMRKLCHIGPTVMKIGEGGGEYVKNNNSNKHNKGKTVATAATPLWSKKNRSLFNI